MKSKFSFLPHCLVLLAACTEKPVAVIDSVSPKSGKPGSSFLITGNGFNDVEWLHVGGESMSHILISDTEMRVDVPWGTHGGEITMGGFLDKEAVGPSFTVAYHEEFTAPVPFVELMAFGEYHCGRSAAGELLCWSPSCKAPFGRNTDGSIKFVEMKAEEPWKTLPNLGRWCGLLDSGRVACLGDSLAPSGITYPYPGTWKLIAPQYGQFCGIDLDGQFQCAGNGDTGAVNLTYATRFTFETQLDIEKMVSSGQEAYLFLTTDHKLRALQTIFYWDYNGSMDYAVMFNWENEYFFPSLPKDAEGWTDLWIQGNTVYGIQNSTLMSVGTEMTSLEKIPGAKAVSYGESFCIIDADNKVQCKNSIFQNEIFNIPNEDQNLLSFQTAPFVKDASLLAVDSLACAMESKGTLKCWNGPYTVTPELDKEQRNPDVFTCDLNSPRLSPR